MKNAVAEGKTVSFTPSTAKASGEAVLIGSWLGVAVNDVAANTPGVFRIEGVFTLPKLSTDAVSAAGAPLYWDNTNSRLTTTASGNTLSGKSYDASGSGTATVQIKINA